jgi:hypothetical protein
LIETTDRPGPIRDLVLYFLGLGLLGFGGPVALVGQMERELESERGWLTKEQMREVIAVCQSLPGPLAIQVGIFIAYLRSGFWGAMAKATTTLKAATDKAEQESAGYRAVSVVPMLKQHHAVAMVTLVKGAQFKSVSEPLE